MSRVAFVDDVVDLRVLIFVIDILLFNDFFILNDLFFFKDSLEDDGLTYKKAPMDAGNFIIQFLFYYFKLKSNIKKAHFINRSKNIQI